MNALIPLYVAELSGESQDAVDARELYTFLESKQHFADWIKSRITDYGFIEGVDFAPLHKKMERENQGLTRFLPGQNRIDYALSLDMAKELAMLERNEKGRLARKYFIDMERRVRAQAWTLASMADEVLKARPLWVRIKHYQEKGLTNGEIGKLLDCSESTIRRHKTQMRACGLLPSNVKPLRIVQGGAS